jgi:hypothetical protein
MWRDATGGSVALLLESATVVQSPPPVPNRRTATMREANITEPAVLFRLKASIRPHMSGQTLYEATRGVWKMGPRRERARLAFAVIGGEIAEVFLIEGWQVAGTSEYTTRPRIEVNRPDRWEFVGEVASASIRDRNIERTAKRYITPLSSNPVTYVNLD